MRKRLVAAVFAGTLLLFGAPEGAFAHGGSGGGGGGGGHSGSGQSASGRRGLPGKCCSRNRYISSRDTGVMPAFTGPPT